MSKVSTVDTHLDALDTYIYFSTHSSHQYLDSILNPNFDLHTILPQQSLMNFCNIWIVFSVIFMIFQSHKIIFAPRCTNTIVGIFPSLITYRLSNILHLGFYWHRHNAHWHVRSDQIYYLCVGHGFYDTVLLPQWFCFIINYSWLVSIFSSFISPFLWLISGCIKKDHMHISIKFYFDPYSILLPFTHMDYICFQFIIFSSIPFSLVLFFPIFSSFSYKKLMYLALKNKQSSSPHRTDLFSTILRILLSSSSLSRLNLSIVLVSNIIPIML